MTTPTSLRSAAGQLFVDWSDGSHSQIAHARLRAACPCSQCRAARLRGRIDLVLVNIRLQAVNAQGYGAQLVFSDGHDRGIYPWDYLRELSA
ncbi:DUF971 domain-containing protein [Pseudomonas sp. Z8(2022)]|uniref:DUF971 domain-containing protein n=1 Tax=Pseudomonadaceae TaxID=135621 RepID=UPI0021F491CE|nr:MULTISPECIES: DUF971 domain-containing protein [Pseudomonas]UYP32313.1 DUF971 domain-containing protein [Pseudomonas sp. Z8(2022)]